MENQTPPKKIETIDLKAGRYALYKLDEAGNQELKDTGCILRPLLVGTSFMIGTTAHWYITSVVTEIQRTGKGAKFYTLNSEYLIEEQ